MGQAPSKFFQWLRISMHRALSKILKYLWGEEDHKERPSKENYQLPQSRPSYSPWKSKPEGCACILIPLLSDVHRCAVSSDPSHYQTSSFLDSSPSQPTLDSSTESKPQGSTYLVNKFVRNPSLLGSDSSVRESNLYCTILIRPTKSVELRIPSANSHDHISSSQASYISILIPDDTIDENTNKFSDSAKDVFCYTKEVVEESNYKPVVPSPSKVKLKVPLKEKIGKGITTKDRWINHYSSAHRILLVGEGDFSFSASLALAFGSATNIIATSLNSEGFLRKNYKKAMCNIQGLRIRGGLVIHGVDATEMANDLLLSGKTFDCVIFNFPHAGFVTNESRKSSLRQHQKLIDGFLANAKEMIDEKGEIHITHKSNGFFLEWDLQRLASNRGLNLLEQVNFNVADYPGYGTKYGFGGDKCFNCNPSKTYKFGL